jgi:hypothetical protein
VQLLKSLVIIPRPSVRLFGNGCSKNPHDCDDMWHRA